MRVKTDEKVVNNSNDEELIQALRSIWLGMRDSNPRMPVPKTGALPLGQSPVTD
jgi:hypothetical protein